MLWNLLYVGIKFYRESSKSDFESIGLPSNIGETGNTGSSIHFRSFLSFLSWKFSWVLHKGDTARHTGQIQIAQKMLHIGCIRCIIWLQILQLIHWSKNFWISPTQIFQIVFFQNSWTESKFRLQSRIEHKISCRMVRIRTVRGNPTFDPLKYVKEVVTWSIYMTHFWSTRISPRN